MINRFLWQVGCAYTPGCHCNQAVVKRVVMFFLKGNPTFVQREQRMQKSETIYSSNPKWSRVEVEEEVEIVQSNFKYHKTILKRYF